MTSSGLYCVRFGLVTADTDLEELIAMVYANGKDVEESSKVVVVVIIVVETLPKVVPHACCWIAVSCELLYQVNVNVLVSCTLAVSWCK